MPWQASDASSHTKEADTDHLKDVWAAAANAALKQYDGDEGKALAVAAAAVTAAKKKKDGDGGRAGPPSMLYRDMRLELEKPSSLDLEKRTVDSIISVGAKVRRRDMWDGSTWDEVLTVGPKSVRLASLNEGGHLVDGHNIMGGLSAILGSVVAGTARIGDGKLRARFQIAHSDHGERLLKDLQAGMPFKLSAGYRTHHEIIDRTTEPEVRTATDWEPLEVSVVAVAAEGNETGLNRTRARPVTEEAIMPNEEKTAALSSADEVRIRADERERIAKEMADKEKANADAAAAEKKRQDEEAVKIRAALNQSADMHKICRGAGLDPKIAEDAVRAGMSMADFHALVGVKLAERSDKNQISGTHQDAGGVAEMGNGSGGGFTNIRDRALDGRAAAMEEALTTRILAARRDVPGIFTSEQAAWCKITNREDLVARARKVYDGHEAPKNERTKTYLGHSMVEMAAECIGYRGPIRVHDVIDILQRAFQSTTDYPGLFENALNKSLLARYQLAMPTYRRLAAERTFTDFRPHPQYRAGDFPTLLPLAEGGALQYGSSAESKETVSVAPYGRIFAISRQMLVNDDMGSIDQILSSASDIVLRFENTTFFAMMLQGAGNIGPVLNQDTTAVFNAATHFNYVASGGGAAPSITTIGTARAALRAQKSLAREGVAEFLNVAPALIVGGPAQETVIDQMITAIAPTLTTSVNPFSGRLSAVVDANITGSNWYIFAEPGQLPCFVYGFLQGNTGPRTRTEEPFGYQGVRISLEHDFGCGAIDFRGVYQNFGA